MFRGIPIWKQSGNICHGGKLSFSREQLDDFGLFVYIFVIIHLYTYPLDEFKTRHVWTSLTINAKSSQRTRSNIRLKTSNNSQYKYMIWLEKVHHNRIQTESEPSLFHNEIPNSKSVINNKKRSSKISKS
jgi:hypothetical protein